MKRSLQEKKKESFPGMFRVVAVVISLSCLLIVLPAEAAKKKTTCHEAHTECVKKCKMQAFGSFHQDCFAATQPWKHCSPNATWQVEEQSCLRGCSISAEECHKLAKQKKE